MELLKDAGDFSAYGSNQYIEGTKQFLSSNSIVAKICFLILIIILFILFLRLGIFVLRYVFSIDNDPYLIKGMIDAKKQHTISQDPNVAGSIPIMRSSNKRDGLEFTWSVWIFIDDVNYLQNRYKHVFHKGNDNISPNGIVYPNNAPGVYISPIDDVKNYMNLLVRMNIFTNQDNQNDTINEHGDPNIYEDIVIDDVPINKWVNLVVRCNSENIVDVYINGTLVKRHKLSGVVRQNYDSVYTSMNGGFSGFISDLRYFNYALGTLRINQIVSWGPNYKIKDSNLKNSSPYYLSSRWFNFEKDQLYK